MKSEWVLCPVCGSKTRLKLREDTSLENYPLFCPKCKQERLISAKGLKVVVVEEKHPYNWESSTEVVLIE